MNQHDVECVHRVSSKDVCTQCNAMFRDYNLTTRMSDLDFRLESRRRILRLESTVRNMLR